MTDPAVPAVPAEGPHVSVDVRCALCGAPRAITADLCPECRTILDERARPHAAHLVGPTTRAHVRKILAELARMMFADTRVSP